MSTRAAVCLLDRFPALAGADLDVEAGEVVLLTGANGAGKTTLLRMLATLVPLRSGRGAVCGHDLARSAREVRRHVGLVGHETFCYDDLTVGENLEFAVRAAHLPVRGARDALDQLGLHAVADVVHARLSAGQRRRLALAVALVRAPDVLLLDEPHAGLDADGRDVVDRIVASAAADGRTVLLASHEHDRARRLATREVQVVAGQLVGGVVTQPAPRAAVDVEVRA
ncbi:MAG TPA: heme ABC exporter ATP-binding protein CcmA [Acidimicrobiia bacterium]|nr:heme ABC exporter ATP-binding protein CcmA [Acidimicrobiia bacterium]